jgi:anaerobic selenocysteine-containing dehydrogenase
MGYGSEDAVTREIRAAYQAAVADAPAPKLQRVESPQAPSLDARMPLRLYTGRLMFDHSTILREARVIPGLAPAAFAEIHPADAARAGVTDGERVTVVSPYGQLGLVARVTEDTPAGSVFVPSGYNDAPVTSLWVECSDTVPCRIARAGGE